MNDRENMVIGSESFDFDDLERKWESELEDQLSDLKILEEERDKINNPEALGSTVMNIVWEQIINQIGVSAGEDFIAENRGLTLDLRDDAHIQTTENFAKGNIAAHNSKIDHHQRYKDWQKNFKRDNNGNVITKMDNRSGKEKAVLTNEARRDFDKNRPVGSASVDMDHTVPAAEIIRDPAANAHMTKEEQVNFANSEKNLNPLDSSANKSKSDSSMEEWLGSERNGQKPEERFNIDEEKLRQKDKEARAEYEKQKKEGEERSVQAGKQSQKEEALRIGGKALRAVVMGFLADLIKNIIGKLIAWIKMGGKSFQTFIDQIKEAIKSFIDNLHQSVLTAGNTLATTIATAIIGPVVGTIKKAWMLLKQGAKSIKEAIEYIRKPENRNKPIGIMMLEVGKIITAGFAAAGALVLGEVIEEGLMVIPAFAVEIPLLGSLANILGVFFGALVSGIVGAVALNIIDKAVAKKQKENNRIQQINKRNEILNTQANLFGVAESKLVQTKSQVQSTISNRHRAAAKIIRESVDNIFKEDDFNNDDSFDEINDLLNNL